jgi:hypothetical protein
VFPFGDRILTLEDGRVVETKQVEPAFAGTP